MVLISILTIRNFKQIHRVNMGNQRRRDIQLIRILLIQVSILVLFSIPVAIQKLYASSTVFMSKNSLTTAIENLVNQISIEISYISNSTTFYVYSITSKKYRHEVFQILSLIFTRHRGNNANQIQPIERSILNSNKTRTNLNVEVQRSTT